MSGLTRSLLAAALTLPLLAFVVVALVTPDGPAPDRSRPVIIGQVDRPTDGGAGRTRGPADPRDVADREDDDGRDDRDDAGEPAPPPEPVVTPAPRDLDDDDDRVGDDDDDDDDRAGDDDGDDDD